MGCCWGWLPAGDSYIGMHCIAAKVNHKLVPLQHELRSGDQVEVLTSKTQMPKPEWENINCRGCPLWF